MIEEQKIIWAANKADVQKSGSQLAGRRSFTASPREETETLRLPQSTSYCGISASEELRLHPLQLPALQLKYSSHEFRNKTISRFKPSRSGEAATRASFQPTRQVVLTDGFRLCRVWTACRFLLCATWATSDKHKIYGCTNYNYSKRMTDGVKVPEEAGGRGARPRTKQEKVTNNSRCRFAFLYTDCAVVPAAHVNESLH